MHMRQIEPLLTGGRRQVNDSRYMAVADHWTETSYAGVPVAAYAELELSYAQIAALTTGLRATLAAGIRDVIDDSGSPGTISLTIWQYTVASQPVSAR
jgi:hypothetical protein